MILLYECDCNDSHFSLMTCCLIGTERERVWVWQKCKQKLVRFDDRNTRCDIFANLIGVDHTLCFWIVFTVWVVWDWIILLFCYIFVITCKDMNVSIDMKNTKIEKKFNTNHLNAIPNLFNFLSFMKHEMRMYEEYLNCSFQHNLLPMSRNDKKVS